MFYLIEFINYISICITDGDWLNDHLVSFPEMLTAREMLLDVGTAISLLMGN